MTANEVLRDEMIAHAIASQQFGRQLARKIVKLLNSADADLVETIAKRLAMIEERGLDRGPETTRRLNELLAEIQAINGAVYSKVADGVTVDLADMAEAEAAIARTTIVTALAVNVPLKLPRATYLRTLVETSPIDGHLLNSWTDTMSANRYARVEKAIRIGLLEGETTDEIVTRIAGTKVNRYKDGLLEISRQSAEKFVLTANSTVANNARLATYKENPKTIRGVRWTSTLDTRTSTVCQSRDGKFWSLDEEHPTPPAHIKCRSLLIPELKSWQEIGIDREEVPLTTRASIDGQVPASTTYREWIGRQSDERLIAVFGQRRTKMFRDGEVTIDQLYTKDDKLRTLSELGAR